LTILGIHHVQVAMPAGEERRARGFYGDLLGMTEIVKPAMLAGKGGVWFRCGGHELHCGVEKDFRPARKAHPAFLVEGLASLRAKLLAAGVVTEEGEDLPGWRRFYAYDPFGNRLEFAERPG